MPLGATASSCCVTDVSGTRPIVLKSSCAIARPSTRSPSSILLERFNLILERIWEEYWKWTLSTHQSVLRLFAQLRKCKRSPPINTICKSSFVVCYCFTRTVFQTKVLGIGNLSHSFIGNLTVSGGVREYFKAVRQLWQHTLTIQSSCYLGSFFNFPARATDLIIKWLCSKTRHSIWLIINWLRIFGNA